MHGSQMHTNLRAVFLSAVVWRLNRVGSVPARFCVRGRQRGAPTRIVRDAGVRCSGRAVRDATMRHRKRQPSPADNCERVCPRGQPDHAFSQKPTGIHARSQNPTVQITRARKIRPSAAENDERVCSRGHGGAVLGRVAGPCRLGRTSVWCAGDSIAVGPPASNRWAYL